MWSIAFSCFLTACHSPGKAKGEQIVCHGNDGLNGKASDAASGKASDFFLKRSTYPDTL